MKRLMNHIRRWDIWRKGCLNGKFHKLLVLLGLRKSPTLMMILLQEEIYDYSKPMKIDEDILENLNSIPLVNPIPADELRQNLRGADSKMKSNNYEMEDWMYSIKDWILRQDNKFKYQLLDRMRQDCQYYIRNGFKTANCLWADSEKEQIETMKLIWNSFSDDDKPEWLTCEEILEFEEDVSLNMFERSDNILSYAKSTFLIIRKE